MATYSEHAQRQLDIASGIAADQRTKITGEVFRYIDASGADLYGWTLYQNEDCVGSSFGKTYRAIEGATRAARTYAKRYGYGTVDRFTIRV